MAIKGVLTQYQIGQNYYGSYIIGNSMNDIKLKAQKRGLNESIISQLQFITPIPDFAKLNNYEFLIQLPQILHTSCFIALIAINSQGINICDLLGDEGLLHEMTHLMTGSMPITDGSLKSLRTKFTNLREMAIGLYYNPT